MVTFFIKFVILGPSRGPLGIHLGISEVCLVYLFAQSTSVEDLPVGEEGFNQLEFVSAAVALGIIFYMYFVPLGPSLGPCSVLFLNYCRSLPKAEVTQPKYLLILNQVLLI